MRDIDTLARLDNIFKLLKEGATAEDVDQKLAERERERKKRLRVPVHVQQPGKIQQEEKPQRFQAEIIEERRQRLVTVASVLENVERVVYVKKNYNTFSPSDNRYKVGVMFQERSWPWNMSVDVRAKASNISDVRRRAMREKGLLPEEFRGWCAERSIIFLSASMPIQEMVASFQSQVNDIHLANLMRGRLS